MEHKIEVDIIVLEKFLKTIKIAADRKIFSEIELWGIEPFFNQISDEIIRIKFPQENQEDSQINEKINEIVLGE